MKKIHISASRNYNVIMEKGALSRAGSYVQEALGLVPNLDAISASTSAASYGRKICLITDETVDKLYGQPTHALWQSLENVGFEVCKYVFPGGEASKTMGTVTSVLDYLAENHFTRSDVLVALGGGITGDITGFTAATYLRGIEFIQIPTSLLAIVDSSVGGKTGVNLPAGKNLAGAFWQPSLVLFDPAVLSTLSYDLILDGIAEAIKAGCIADREILHMSEDRLQKSGAVTSTHIPDLDSDFLTDLALRAIQVKRQIVEADEHESDKRQLLNFGHTVAHAIEKCSCYKISHGHAVAMGMLIISAATERQSRAEQDASQNHTITSSGKGGIYSILLNILSAFKFPLKCPYTAAELAEAALQDKKRRGKTITLVIPDALGKCQLKNIDIDSLEKFINAGLEAL